MCYFCVRITWVATDGAVLTLPRLLPLNWTVGVPGILAATVEDALIALVPPRFLHKLLLLLLFEHQSNGCSCCIYLHSPHLTMHVTDRSFSYAAMVDQSRPAHSQVIWLEVFSYICRHKSPGLFTETDRRLFDGFVICSPS